MIIVAFMVLSGIGYAYADSNADRISCLPLDRQGCGCSLAIKNSECVGDKSQYQFFSELFDGAPLWVGIDNRAIELKSTRIVTDSSGFSFSGGDSWSESYTANGGVSVNIDYRPGIKSCPKSKGIDGCEYFDVEATVRVERVGNEERYAAKGVCGC